MLFTWEWLPGELLSVRVTVKEEEEEEEDNDEEFEVTEGIIDTEECGCESWISDFAIAAVLLVGNKLTLWLLFNEVLLYIFETELVFVGLLFATLACGSRLKVSPVL